MKCLSHDRLVNQTIFRVAMKAQTMTHHNSHTPKNTPTSLLTLLPVILLAPALNPQRALFWGTPILQFYPWRKAALHLIQTGQIPWWLPEVGMGAPLAANHQSALFYPPTWLALALGWLGGETALIWGHAVVAVGHLILAAWGMYHLAQALGLRTPGPLVSGLAYALSGYLVARLGFFSINAATAWVPWVLLGVLRLVRSPNRAVWARLSLAIGLQWLAGHAQTAWYTGVLAALWALFLLILRPRQKRRAGLWLFSAALAALAVAAVQIVPTAEYLSQSWRATGVPPEEALAYSFWPWHGLNFLSPMAFGTPARGDFWGFGNYWEDAVYVGLLTLLLAFAALGRALRRRGWSYHRLLALFWFGVALLGMTLALGQHSPLFRWLYAHVPTFDLFRAPTRWSLWTEIGLALLAGLGAHGWHRPQGRGLYWTRLAATAALAVTLGAGLAWWVTRTTHPTLIWAFTLAGIWALGSAGLHLLAPPSGRAEYRRRWAWAVGLWLGADLLVAGWGLNPTLPMAALTTPRLEIQEVKRQVGTGRLFLPPEDEYRLKFARFFRFDTFSPPQGWKALRPSLLPNLTLWEGIPSANHFDPLLPGRFVSWLTMWEQASPAGQERLLDRMGVTVLERVATEPPYAFAFIPRATAEPLVRWVPWAWVASSPEAAQQAVLRRAEQGGAAWRCAVVLEGNSAPALTPPEPLVTCPQTQVSITPLRITPTQRVWEVRSDRPGLLFEAEVWYPGWRAWVDDRPVPLLRAEYLFRAVAVPAGKHRVVVRYMPGWWPGMGWLSALSGLLLLAASRSPSRSGNTRP